MIRWEPIVPMPQTPTSTAGTQASTEAFALFVARSGADAQAPHGAAGEPADGHSTVLGPTPPSPAVDSQRPDASMLQTCPSSQYSVTRTPANDLASGLYDAQLQVADEALLLSSAELEPDPYIREVVNLPLRLELRGADGRVEIVDAPWRLASTGQLAQSTRQTHAPSLSGATEHPHAHPAWTNAVKVVEAPLGAAFAAGSRRSTPVPVHALAGPAFARAATGGDETSPAGTSGLTAAVADWTERLVRWIESQGRGAVFIRDYRLDHDAADRIGEQLRALAHAHAVPLERITVNGRAVWQAPVAAREDAYAR
jgi:hypothetical protein